MKPKVKSLFPTVKPPVGDIDINKILVSRQNRRMRLILGEAIADSEARRLGDTVKSELHLRSIDIVAEDKHEAAAGANDAVKVYVSDESYISPERRTKREHFDKNEIITMIYGRTINDDLVPIRSIGENSGRVAFKGEIFGLEYKSIKSKKNGKEYDLVMIDVTDYDDSVSVQLFITRTDDGELFKKVSGALKVGMSVVIAGKASYSEYQHEAIVSASSIAETYAIRTVPVDDAPVKRVELHMHTQMSAMDAVSSAKDLINRAIRWGHKAVAITDHGVVQSYPDAMHASDYNKKIKVLYGIEGYLVDDSRLITEDATDETLDSPFVVFDIETTGLDKYKNHITEIGAVKVENGKVTDTWSSFVNPCEPIPPNIVELTSITDDMVKDAPKIEEILGSFLEFCKGCVLVAHNAQFDVGFMRINAERAGVPFKFCVCDTLTLARCMYPDLPNHKLNTLSKHLNVALEHHHRAVDDAKATADVFVKMIAELKQMGKSKLCELNDDFDTASSAKKNKAYHIILLAKNLKGIRNIYELVSASHLKYFYRVPRIPRSVLKKHREGLIIGSACEAGEFFRAVVDGENDEQLIEKAKFYDYLEIQPIGNNAYMKSADEYPNINTDEDLQRLNMRVVEIGEKMGKPVCATCDVHFMDPYGANFRKILMNYKGFKDADNQAPLYFRTTEQMLAEFEYLGKEKAYEVVVTNTNMIADMIEDVRPIPKEKCPPVVEGAEEAIVNDSHKKAESIYGSPLPAPVKERLDKELHSITTYGFSVMYRIAQELVRKSLSDGYLVGSRGSVGSSFVAFLSDITEVNSLPAHYICPKCKNLEFIQNGTGISGCDLPDKVCPKCGTPYNKDGHDIPFETFLGFKGDKEPDIDLNFSGEYQPQIHKYTETFFGEGYVFRAGTIGTVAEKTAYGYVQRYSEDKGISIRNAEKKRLAAGCVGVKRTSGQHPGGIIVVPYTNDIHEFCPVQHPADDPNSDIITTHFDYHSIDQNLLKLDELGHDDPTVIRMLQDLTGFDPQTIPLDDEETMSLFTSNKALHLKEDIGTKLGTYGVPEFGTKFVRQMLEDTKPTHFSDLVRLSGLSHGTDVWLNNAQDLIRAGTIDLQHAICCRDDIMIYLISMGVEAGHAFKIMESVRKGKGLKPEDEAAMREKNVPDWYIDSCKKIKYMFPKAHAVAYVTSAFRIAYYKVHFPIAFYIAYFSVRADDFDASIMANGIDVARKALADIAQKKRDGTNTPKDEALIPILEICIEMYARGYKFIPIDLYKSHATNFLPTEDGILPPLNALPGLGSNAANAIMEGRGTEPFRTIAEFRTKTGSTRSVTDLLKQYHCFDGVPETNQVSLFDE